MQRGCLPIVVLICVIAIGVMAYFLGRKSGNKTIDSIAMNVAFVQEVAELSSLEAQGSASIKTTNIVNDGSITDEFRKLFLERTVNITIPYIAKYGVDLGNQQINIEEKNKQVFIVIPTPQLLSYELRLDKADAITKKGLLENANETLYGSIQKKLYAASRAQLENNPVYIQQSKDKIRKILESYYAPMNYKVSVSFTDEIKSKVTKPVN